MNKNKINQKRQTVQLSHACYLIYKYIFWAKKTFFSFFFINDLKIATAHCCKTLVKKIFGLFDSLLFLF